MWAALAVLCGVEGGVGDGWHPGDAEEGVAQGGQDVGVVLGGGGDVAADGVAVLGGCLGAEAAGDLVLGFGGAQATAPRKAAASGTAVWGGTAGSPFSRAWFAAWMSWRRAAAAAAGQAEAG